MSAPEISPVVRAILSKNLNLSADAVMKMAKDKGVTAPDASIRKAVHNIKSTLRKEAEKAGKPIPAAARETKAPKSPPPATVAPVVPEVTDVFANVKLVNKVVGVAGGVDQAQQVAEAVRACGGVDAFLKHLELVAGIRGTGA